MRSPSGNAYTTPITEQGWAQFITSPNSSQSKKHKNGQPFFPAQKPGFSEYKRSGYSPYLHYICIVSNLFDHTLFWSRRGSARMSEISLRCEFFRPGKAVTMRVQSRGETRRHRILAGPDRLALESAGSHIKEKKPVAGRDVQT
jgi:hypothetical protein